ncbi:MAG: histidine kinase, partial [Oscillospiraceae bacterium]
MKRLRKYSHTIFVQLVVFSLFIGILPTFILCFFSYGKLLEITESELKNSQRQIVSEYKSNVEKKLEQYSYSLDMIVENTVIKDTIAQSDENYFTRGQIITEELTKSLLLDKQKEIRNCMIYTEEKNKIYGNRVASISGATLEDWYAIRKSIDVGNFSYIANRSTTPVLSILRNIQQVDVQSFDVKQLGVIKLDLYMKKLFQPAVLEDIPSKFQIYVLDNLGKGYYSSDSALNVGEALAALGENTEAQVDGGIVFQQKLNDYDLNMLFYFDNGEMPAKQGKIILLVLPVFVGIVVFVVFGSAIYSRRFSKRINQLVARFRKAETGDLTVDKPLPGNDEITELNIHFSHMLETLDELIKKDYLWQIENKEAQIKNLQLQINPHFLYNTLETISAMAAVEGVFSVCEMCEKLGELFRYSLGKDYGELVTVGDELKSTQNYIFIQQTRYKNKFDVYYNIEIDLEKYMILRFILQPIVENAILHGLAVRAEKGSI